MKLHSRFINLERAFKASYSCWFWFAKGVATCAPVYMCIRKKYQILINTNKRKMGVKAVAESGKKISQTWGRTIAYIPLTH